MRDVIARVVDGSRFREFKKEYGPTIVTVRSTPLLIRSHPSWFTGVCPHPWALGGCCGEQWNSVLPIGLEGDTFHRTVLAAEDPPLVPRKRHR